MAIKHEKILYPLMQNIIYVHYLTGLNISFRYSNKAEARYIMKNLNEQAGIDTYINDDNDDEKLGSKIDKPGYITVKCPAEFAKDSTKCYKVEFENFQIFRQEYLKTNRTNTISAIESNLSEDKNNIIMQKLVSFISWLSIFITATIVDLIMCSPRVANNRLVTGLVCLLILSGAMLLMFLSSNIKIHNSNIPIVPTKYKVYPAKWLIFYILFDLAILLIALIDFHIKINYLLNPQFYWNYLYTYILYFISAINIRDITIQL